MSSKLLKDLRETFESFLMTAKEGKGEQGAFFVTMICWVKEQDVRQINRVQLKAIDAELVDLPQSDMYQHVSLL